MAINFTTAAATTFEKKISYNRENRDYDAYLDGDYKGSFPTYHQAEVALDQIAYDLLADEQVVTADIAAMQCKLCGDAGCDVCDPKPTCEGCGAAMLTAHADLDHESYLQCSRCGRVRPVEQFPFAKGQELLHNTTGQRGIVQGWTIQERKGKAPRYIMGLRWSYPSGDSAYSSSIDGWWPAEPVPADEPVVCFELGCTEVARHAITTNEESEYYCCLHYSEEIGRLCGCELNFLMTGTFDPLPTCRGNGFGPCDQPATVGGYCPRCAAFLDKVFIAAMTDRALDTVRPAERFSVTLRAEPVRVPRQVCLICGGNHSAEHCPRIRMLQQQAYDLALTIAHLSGALVPSNTLDELRHWKRLDRAWRRAMNRWRRRLGQPQIYFCRACEGMHETQRCPRIWLELRRPAEVFYEAAA